MSKSVNEVLRLLERLLQVADINKRASNMVDVMILKALAYHATGDLVKAVNYLKQAHSTTSPDRYVRRLIDEGLPMRNLLRDAEAYGLSNEHTNHALSLLDETAYNTSPITVQHESLIESLTIREVEVLQLIAQGLSNREISDQLYVAVDTVKGHNRRIYGKLHVQRRTEAVARARELGII